MATTIQKPPRINADQPSSGGGSGDLPGIGLMRRVADSSPASRTGVWVGLAAITMTFAAFTSAMVIRQGSAYDWQHFTLPGVLYFDTGVLLASSFTLELARKNVSGYVHGAQRLYSSAKLCLWLTLGLGLVFLCGQYAAWQQLRSHGLYLATSPSSSFFYLFTVLHALHLLGGLAGLGLAVRRFSKSPPTLRISTLSTVSYYWHFMDLLWMYLLLVLWWRI
jgi:cytochrome c oxidase subunit III